MKKRIFAGVLTIVLGLMTASASFAQEIPKIMAGEREIVLDVEGEYVDGVFVAPIRRICSIANARCDWYGDEQRIIVNSKDNVTRLFLYIQKDTFRIFTFTSIMSGIGENFELEAPLRIVDGRTLVPFEQICRALNMEYEWNEDKSVVTVKTDEVITDDRKVEFSIVADKEDVAKDEIVELSLVAKNMDLYPDYYYSGYSAAIIYDSDKFEMVSSCMTNPAGGESGGMGADNPEFSDDSLKVVYVTIEKLEYTDEIIAGKVQLKALTDDGGSFRLSDRITTLGYDTTLLLTDKNDVNNMLSLEKASVFKINTEDVVVK